MPYEVAERKKMKHNHILEQQAIHHKEYVLIIYYGILKKLNIAYLYMRYTLSINNDTLKKLNIA